MCNTLENLRTEKYYKLNSLVPSNLFTAWAAFKYHLNKVMNITISTKVGINVQGRAIAFKINILIIARYIWIHSSKLLGSNSSIAPKSFENLFSTRPKTIVAIRCRLVILNYYLLNNIKQTYILLSQGYKIVNYW